MTSHDHATALLGEIDTTPGSHDNYGAYPSLLLAMVRTALTTNNPQLAHQLTTGVQPHTPYELDPDKRSELFNLAELVPGAIKVKA